MKKKNLLLSLSLASGLTLSCPLSSTAQDSFNGYTVADEGAWCWFADPRAMHYENDQTNATYIGYIDVHGSIKATQIDFKTNTASEVLIRSYFQPDDHNNPAFLTLPDGRIMIFYSRHTDEACFYYRISKKPGDITSLGEEKVLKTANNTTYPNPFILSDDPDHIYLCWRGINWHPTVAQLSMPDENDNCSWTWGPKQMVQSTGARPYAKYISNGKDKIYVSYTTGHPDNEYPNWLYFNAFNINSRQMEDINGKVLSNVDDGPFKVSKTESFANTYPATIVDRTADRRDWLWNIAFDKNGNPAIGMVKINNGKDSHDYYYAKWNGTNWTQTFLANGGGHFHQTPTTERCYSGGMAIDRDNPEIVYCSVPVEGKYGKVYEIVKYTLDDNGKVADEEQITHDSKLNNVRPYVIEGTKDSPLRVTWMNGLYYYWIVNSTYPKGYPTSIQADWQLPESEIGDIDIMEAIDKQLTADETYTLKAEGDGKDGFSISLDLSISHDNYGGTIFKADGFEYGLDKETMKPYVKIGDETYKSQNVLGTADSWKGLNATTNGQWLEVYKLDRWNLTVTYAEGTDGNGVLTVYRNGLIDQRIDCGKLSMGDITIGGFDGVVYSGANVSRTLNQTEVKNLITKGEMSSLFVPSVITTDIVLPTATNTSKPIIWTSSNPETVSTDGTVNLPEAETDVTLTADINGMKKEFAAKVMPRNIDSNLMAYYTFEQEDAEDSDRGVFVKDMSGNGMDARIEGNAAIDGTLNLSANTTGGFTTNGYAVAPSEILDSMRSYTFMTTIKAGSLNSQPRIYDFGSSSGNSIFLRANGLAGGIKYNNGSTQLLSTSASLKTGEETKIAVTYDAKSGMTKIYVNGKIEASDNNTITHEAYELYQISRDTRNYIGRTQWWDSQYASDNVDFKGTIDDFRVYNIALTKEEIWEIQNIEIEDEEITEIQGGKNLIKDGDFSGTAANSAPAGWKQSDNTMGGSLHSRVLSTNRESGNLMYIRFDGTNSSQTSAYTYGDTKGYELKFKADSLYTLTYDCGCWGGNYTGDALVFTIYDVDGDEVCSMETATPNNLEGGSGFVSGKLEFKVGRSGSGKLVITHKSTSNYAAGVDNLCLMIEQNIPDNITDAAADNNERVDVYTIEGYCIKKNVKASDATKNLRKGIYIIGEKKVVVD